MLDPMGYPGGKSGPGVYHRLINLMPPHQTYVEPFLGGGAVMRLKRPAPYSIGVDLDAAVIRQWRSGIGEAAARPRSVTLPISAAACESADAGQEASSGESAAARSTANAPIWAPEISADTGAFADPRVSARSPISDPPRFRFLRGDALTFLQSYPFAQDDVIYCDPPYLMSTRSSGPLYRHEFSDEQHAELLSTIGELPCRVMISGYWSELYASRLHRWNSIHFETMTRGGMATEWVWYNYDAPVALHDYRFLGESFRQRQDLKRQIASWTGKLKRMPPLKKQALLAAIAAGIGENDGGIR